MKTFFFFLNSFNSQSDDNNNSNNNNNHQSTYNLLCGPTTSNSHFEQSHFDNTLNQSTNFNVSESNNSLMAMPMHQNMHPHTHTPHYHVQHNGNHVYYNWQVSTFYLLLFFDIFIFNLIYLYI